MDGSPAESKDREIRKLSVAEDLTGTWPLQVRQFVLRHVEHFFIIVLITVVLAVFYLFPYKIAFLNLFYLPILTAAYFLGKRKAVMASVLCILLVMFAALIYPDWFAVEGTRTDTLLLISTWGGFLILTAVGIGSLQQRLARGFEETKRLYEELKRTRVAEEMKEKVEKTLYATMDPVVAKLATEGKLRFEKREISIMFTDLTGFTTYSDQYPADVVLDELNRYLGHIEPLVEMYRGHIDSIWGDGMMVEFGAPLDYDRHALMAVLAGWKMQEKVKGLTLPWSLRVGIATGTCVVGLFGVHRQAYSALGDRVNVAKRLEEICQPGKVYMDEATFVSVEHFIQATRLRNLGFGRQADQERMERLKALEERLSHEGECAGLFYELGKTHFELRDASSAIRCFENALALDPESTELRLAYAEANLRKDEFENIQLKGKLHRIAVYEVTGIKDRWLDSSIIPARISSKYDSVEKGMEVPADAILAVEAIDGSIGHGKLVALLSYALAEHLNLDENLKRIILQAGYVQDIGKEALPHYILNRSGSLT
jgi:Adenylate cyclase, family 3 (some proteins contain HAMP domain)